MNKDSDRDSLLSRLWDRLVFFGHFFKNPVGMSTPMECSSRIAEVIGDELNEWGARRVVELGGGTGSITAGILDGLPADGELMSIEHEGFLCERLRDRFGDRIEVVQGDARDVENIIANTQFENPDAVVCSVPLNTAWAGELVETISRVLPEDGSCKIAFRCDFLPIELAPSDVVTPIVGRPPLRNPVLEPLKVFSRLLLPASHCRSLSRPSEWR